MLYRTGRKIRKLGIWGVAAIVTVIIVIGLAVTVIVIRQSYIENLRPISNSKTEQYFTVEKGMSAKEIASSLFDQRLIRSASAFEWYVRSNNLRDKLQAGTYVLNPSMSQQQIVSKMVKGDIAKNLLTILPGKRLEQIKEAFVKAGYSEASVEAAFKPEQYRNHPALAELPVGASLEGYLYPDSYEKTTDTTPETIIKASLDELIEKLSPQLKSSLAKQGLNTHDALILGSIVEQEVSKISDKPLVAQVFLRRLREGIPLGADPTSRYASLLKGLETVDYSVDSPYNTRRYAGLPPGPIGNVSLSSLEALAKPSSTNYLFFVAGDDGVTRFSNTQTEHEELTRRYCIELCSQ